MKRAPRDPDRAKRWLAFLRNHREAIAAMDFFTVPTITFGVLYCFFVIRHDRRHILHANVTKHPTSGWKNSRAKESVPIFGLFVLGFADQIVPKETSNSSKQLQPADKNGPSG